MNGNNRLSRAGDYEAAGTTFTYRKREGVGCPGECVRAKGPVNQTVDIQVCIVWIMCIKKINRHYSERVI